MKKSTAAGRTPAPVAAPLVDAAPAAPPEPAKSAAGWDPYEVWRTRVLLPRIEDATATPRAAESNVKPLLRQSA
jgi:hypothetical protein